MSGKTSKSQSSMTAPELAGEIVFAQAWSAHFGQWPVSERALPRPEADGVVFASRWPDDESPRKSRDPAKTTLAPSARLDEEDDDEDDEILFSFPPEARAFCEPDPEPETRASATIPAYAQEAEWDVDSLWESIDSKVSEGLAQGFCPHCGANIGIVSGRTHVTCNLCASSFTTFAVPDAPLHEGNA